MRWRLRSLCRFATDLTQKYLHLSPNSEPFKGHLRQAADPNCHLTRGSRRSEKALIDREVQCGSRRVTGSRWIMNAASCRQVPQVATSAWVMFTDPPTLRRRCCGGRFCYEAGNGDLGANVEGQAKRADRRLMAEIA